MKLLTVILGFLFLIGANIAQADETVIGFSVENQDQKVDFWILEDNQKTELTNLISN